MDSGKSYQALHSLVTWVLIEARQDHGEMQNRKCHIRCFPVISLRFLILLWDITFKPSVLEKMKLGNLRLYATVQNPFIFCAKDVVDPEQLNVSINTSDAMTRNVIFGINLSFK